MKAIEQEYKILSMRALTDTVFEMKLGGDMSLITRAGQFVNLEVPGKYLRRPISVCDYTADTLTLLIKVVGEGTEELSQMKPGTVVNTLTGLGNGFSEDRECAAPLLLGGGIGIAPLFNLAKKFLARGIKPVVVLGFNNVSEVCYEEEFRSLGVETHICTVDGTHGVRGFVTDAIREKKINADYFYACGPTPMLRALCENLDIPGEVSLESRMACGFGICMCCVVQTKKGGKGICKAGPVFDKDELIWK